MSRFFKILAVLLVFVLVLIFAANLALKSYLKSDKLKRFVESKAETVLNRKVTVGKIQVSLFKGITLSEFAVREKNKNKDFFKVKKLVLRYDLIPLLHKKIVISEILILNPVLNIYRDKQGRFNYETLPILSKKKKKESEKPSELPLSIIAKSITIKEGHIAFKDELGEIPSLDLNFNSVVSLSSPKGKEIYFKGKANFNLTANYSPIKLLASGNLLFDPSSVKYNISTKLGKEELDFKGVLSNYMKKPELVLNIFSPHVDIGELQKILKNLKGKGKKTASSRSSGFNVVSAVVKGKIYLKELVYKKLKVTDVKGSYIFKDGVFDLSDLNTLLGSGKVFTSFKLALLSKTYSGLLKIQKIDMGALIPAVFNRTTGIITGSLDLDFDFSGRYFEWDLAKRHLSAKGDFLLKNGRFLNFRSVNAISDVLKLEEFKDLAFDELKGNVRVKNGKLLLNSSLSSKDIKLKAKGFVGFDGSLNLPVLIRLSPSLSKKLIERVSFAQYLPKENNWTLVKVKLTGSLNSPLVAPDTSFIIKKQKSILEKLFH